MMKKILTGNRSNTWFVALILSALMSGCQSSQQQSYVVGSSPAGEGRDVIFQQSCSKEIQKHFLTSPEALYQEMNQCAKEGQLDNATFFFGLAGSYSWFDAQRVNSQFGRTMHSKLLSEAMSQLTKEQKNALWGHIQTVMSDPEKKRLICKKVKEAGMPNYSADYMLLEKKNLPVDPLKASQQWEIAVQSYLECTR